MSWNNRVKGIKKKKVTELVANSMNYRIHPIEQQEALEGAIERIGFSVPPIVTEDGTVIDGHLRVQLAMREGVEEIPVTVVDLDEKEAEEMLLYIDPIASMAVNDEKKMKEIIDDINMGDEKFIELMNMINKDIVDKELVAEIWDDDGDYYAEAEEGRNEVGEHVVYYKSDLVEALGMVEENVRYGFVNVNADEETLYRILIVMREKLVKGGAIYVVDNWGNYSKLCKVIEEAGYEMIGEVVNILSEPVSTAGDYQKKHELIAYAWTGEGSRYFDKRFPYYSCMERNKIKKLGWHTNAYYKGLSVRSSRKGEWCLYVGDGNPYGFLIGQEKAVRRGIAVLNSERDAAKILTLFREGS